MKGCVSETHTIDYHNYFNDAVQTPIVNMISKKVCEKVNPLTK